MAFSPDSRTLLTGGNDGEVRLWNVQRVASTHDVLDLVEHADAYRIEYNTIRPHEAIAWNRPDEVHRGLVDPLTPNFPETENLPTT